MDDHDLLREYVQHQSDRAFAELVARHVNLVYATALRLLREPQAAQDVVQTVFIQLARKAWTVRAGNALSGWLYRTTCRTALNALQSDHRRRLRETEAMKLAEIESAPAAWEQLAPLLDDALQQLSRGDQDAVMLRYFEGRTARETGAALAISEDAAQKRLGRALEKLRMHFVRQGVVISSVGLGSLLATNPGGAVPAGFASRIANVSLAKSGSAGVAATIGGIIFMSTKTILGTLALVGAFTFVIAGGTWFMGKRHATDDTTVPAVARASIALETKAAAPSQATSLSVVANSTIKPATPPATATVPAPATADEPSLRSTATAEAQKDLKTAIPEAIRLLEANDFVAFTKAFMPLDEMRASVPPGTTLDQFIQDFQNRPDFNEQRNQVLDALYQVQSGTLAMGPDGKTATFDYTMANNRKRTMSFKLIDGLWYIDRVD